MLMILIGFCIVISRLVTGKNNVLLTVGAPAIMLGGLLFILFRDLSAACNFRQCPGQGAGTDDPQRSSPGQTCAANSGGRMLHGTLLCE
ncbi:Uncharacterised protein [Klebsiella michiganensis]|uniref:Uncharacterized protein n=1 Tax=Klebsiella michiganensis TaxID=1134687 RepID=A0A7H4PLE5_9ENTR|nr:Uncharacterised protein [Klebsiella michiganensis]